MSNKNDKTNKTNKTNKSNKSNNIGILDPDGKHDNPLTNKEYSEQYKNLAKIWSMFPAYENADKLIKDIISHNVILVISGTGSGKTVLFPKYVLHALDYKGKIAVTLPKQMIAKSAAQFAADTLDVELGTHVGYQYRGSEKGTYSKDTKLLYCTDGTLVAKLLSDPELKDFDAVLIDEAHERKMNIDFLLYLLKKVLKKRPEFKLVIMSATINESIFREYYHKFKYINLEIGAKTNYPIESVFLNKELNINMNEYLTEGKKLIQDILKNTSDGGGILFFVTSVSETNDICDLLMDEDSQFKDTHVCVPVYSGMNEDQEKMATDTDYYRGFVKDGRKIIVATNVAESSLTVKGIKYVIDSGLEISSRYDPIDRIDILEKKLIARAQAKQRMGRTGRTGSGTCYHLYTEKVFNKAMIKFPEPSIRTESISYEIIRLLATPKIDYIKDLRNTFDKFIEPPDKKYVDHEIKYLINLELIDTSKDYGKLTDLGLQVSELQLEPEKALSLMMAYRLNCFREVAAILSVIETIKGSMTQLFTLPLDIVDESEYIDSSSKKQLEWLTKKFEASKADFNNRYGDHIAILKIFKEYEKKREDYDKLKDWSYKYFLKRDKLEESYDLYTKMKRRYKYKIRALNLDKTDREILDTDIKYKIMAALLYGYKLNILHLEDYKVQTFDGRIKNLDIEKYSFLETDTASKKELFCNQLFRYNDKPVRAKIVSKISKKSMDLLIALEKIK